MTWLWLTPLLALVVTWILGRYNARAIESDWEMMLTAKGRGAIEALELQVLCDGAAVESARIGALSARERADFPQATRLAGLAYRAGDADALTAHVERLARDDGARREMARRSRALFERSFNAATIYKAYATHIEQLAAPSPPRAHPIA